MMEIERALSAFAALSSETRFWVLRLLLQAGPAGLSAGEIADSLSARQNTLSTHLKVLKAAGLIDSRRAGRQVVYAARRDALAQLGDFLAEDCGEGRGEGWGEGPAAAGPAPAQPWRLEA